MAGGSAVVAEHGGDGGSVSLSAVAAAAVAATAVAAWQRRWQRSGREAAVGSVAAGRRH
jgi:hypothetical protein